MHSALSQGLDNVHVGLLGFADSDINAGVLLTT